MKAGSCTICLDPLFEDIQVAHCGHVFHRACIYRWIDSFNNTCPNCKQHLDASELTKLILDPLEMIREVLDNPCVLENVNADLLLKLTAAKHCNDEQDDDEEEEENEDDIDLQILNLNTENKSKASDSNHCKKKQKKQQSQMELIQQRIANTALTKHNEELQQQVERLQSAQRSLENEKSELNRKMQGYLNKAKTLESQYFDKEDECSKLNRKLFKKEKEVIETKREIDGLLRQQAMYRQCENIVIGNFGAVTEHEKELEASKPAGDLMRYYKDMYEWVKTQYKLALDDRHKDKELHQIDKSKWSEIHDEQRNKIEEFRQMAEENSHRKEKCKKAYYGVKEKYDRLLKKFKHNVAELNKYKQMKKEQDDNQSVSVHDEGVQDAENVDPAHNNNTHNSAEEEEEEEEEDDDLSVDVNHHHKAMASMDGVKSEQDVVVCQHNKVQSIFSLSNRYSNQGVGGGFGQKQISNGLFGAYREMKARQDSATNNNPFSNNGRKRNYRQISQGSDGRGGVKTFLTDSTNYHKNVNNNNKNHNQIKHKRRRVVKTSTTANHGHLPSKTNITKYFQKHR